MQTTAPPKLIGLLAQFEDLTTFFHAAKKTRLAGYTVFDAHTPFPVHGLDKQMGIADSCLAYLVAGAAIVGFCFAVGIQVWTAGVDYPFMLSGRPLFSWVSFLPITFEVTVLFSGFATVFGMFFLNGLPRYHHPIFSLQVFDKATDDQFFISIEAGDPLFDLESTSAFLLSLGANAVGPYHDK